MNQRGHGHWHGVGKTNHYHFSFDQKYTPNEKVLSLYQRDLLQFKRQGFIKEEKQYSSFTTRICINPDCPSQNMRGEYMEKDEQGNYHCKHCNNKNIIFKNWRL